MVFVNSKKFACESCIKGHRSSSCHHTDRPLFEIKKKGRPVSQCEKCRELRQTRRVHSKCKCNEDPESAVAKPSQPLGPKRRFVPIAPALPNGIRDVLQSARVGLEKLPVDSRQRVNTLLNPCKCPNVWSCQCPSSSSDHSNPSGSGARSTLAALASVAVVASRSCCGGNGGNKPPLAPTTTSAKAPRQIKPPRRTRSQSPTHGTPKRKKAKHASAAVELPPIHDTTFGAFDDDSLEGSELLCAPMPPITIPPISQIASFAGTGCTCGVECGCPGCEEHRGPQHVQAGHGDCASGTCGTCTDNRSGINLPSCSSSGGVASMIDRFLQRAALLPTPPTNRYHGIGLDTTNVQVYPYAAMGSADPSKAVAFGLVNIPKLECCGGNCGCPDGNCGCGNACDGCCAEHNTDRGRSAPVVEVPAVRSCCAGKA